MQSYDNILKGDTFTDNTCCKCEFHGAAFAIPGEIIGACPNCLNGRISALTKKGVEVPRWLLALKVETEQEVYRQLVHDELNIQFYKCTICNKIIIAQDARYYFPPGIYSSSPHCIDCYNKTSENGQLQQVRTIANKPTRTIKEIFRRCFIRLFPLLIIILILYFLWHLFTYGTPGSPYDPPHLTL